MASAPVASQGAVLGIDSHHPGDALDLLPFHNLSFKPIIPHGRSWLRENTITLLGRKRFPLQTVQTRFKTSGSFPHSPPGWDFRRDHSQGLELLWVSCLAEMIHRRQRMDEHFGCLPCGSQTLPEPISHKFCFSCFPASPKPGASSFPTHSSAKETS